MSIKQTPHATSYLEAMVSINSRVYQKGRANENTLNNHLTSLKQLAPDTVLLFDNDEPFLTAKDAVKQIELRLSHRVEAITFVSGLHGGNESSRPV